jgi:site-specific recombinase XerC
MANGQATLEDAISALKAEIDSLEISLSAKRMSYETLIGIAGNLQGNTAQKDSSKAPEIIAHTYPVNSHEGLIDLNDLSDEISAKKRTLIDDVKEVVVRFGSQEFNLGHVDVALKRQGVEVAGKSPKSRISVALVRLCRDEVLARTFTGIGNTPNRYRVRSTMSATEIAQALAQNPLPVETVEL